MKLVIFGSVLVSEVLVGALLLTLLAPCLRIWPPPKKQSWQYYFTWTLTIIAMAGTLVLGILDWNSWVFRHWSRFLLGGILILGGIVFAGWGVKTLGLRTSSGQQGAFVTTGPYQYSRNPQYVGDIAVLAGYALLCNSWLTAMAAEFSMLWFLLAPFTEEPWLQARFGQDYDRYRQNVPRFLGLLRKH